MKSRIIAITLLSGLSWVFLIKCAQVASPVGGAKDETPPKFVQANPPMGATNVNPEKIEIYFNEFIKLQGIRENVLFSPPISGYNIIRKKRSVAIEIPPDSLKPHTTHVIQFGKAIRDLTEGNVAKGFTYVFSTGAKVDSLKMRGNVVNASNLDSVSKGIVLLYKNSDSNYIKNRRPFYYTEVQKDGSFELNFLKEGRYRIYALKDLNNNLQYDGGEKIAFKKAPVHLKKDSFIGDLKMFKQKTEPNKILKTKNKFKGQQKIVFNQPIDTFKILESNVKTSFWKLNPKKKSGIVFFPPSEKDTLKFVLEIDKTTKDTAIIDRRPEFLKGLETDTNFSVKKSKKMLHADSGILLLANRPVKAVVESLFKCFRDSIRVPNVMGKIKGANRDHISLVGDFQADSTYDVVFDSGALIDLYGNRSKKIKVEVNLKGDDDFGLLGVDLKGVKKRLGQKGQVIVQLIKDRENVRYERKVKGGQTKLVFKQIEPGNYRIKVILDRNGNGFWDEGNFLTNETPEYVYFYKETIKVKANWEMRDLKFNLLKKIESGED